MQCQCGAVEYAPAWCVLPGGAALPAGEPVYCAKCAPQPATPTAHAEWSQLQEAVLAHVPQPRAYQPGESRYAMRAGWRE